MKWLERIIWIVLVAILTLGAAVLWAAWKTTEEVWGNEQYLNYMHMLRIQQKLESNELEAAVTSNREWLSMWWGVYLKQQQLNELLISERNFKMLRDEVEASQLGIATPEQK
jgi:hypothetical protein